MSSTASGAEPAARAARRLTLLFPALIFVVYALATPGLLRGEPAGVYATAAAIAEGRGAALDGALAALAPDGAATGAAPGDFPDVAYAAGRYTLARPPGLAALAVSAYLIGRLAAPWLGPEGTILAVALVGPLLAALVARHLLRLSAQRGAIGLVGLVAAAVVGLPLQRARPIALELLLIVALLAIWATPRAARLLGGAGGAADAAILGLLIGGAGLLDYGLGLIGAIVLVGAVGALRWRAGGLRPPTLVVAGAAVPLAGLLAWQTALYGAPWHPAFRSALDPAGRGLRAVFSPELPLTIALPVLVIVALAARQVAPPRRRVGPTGRAMFGLGVAIVFLALALSVGIALRPGTFALAAPIDWRSPAALAALAGVAALIALVGGATGPGGAARPRRVALSAALIAALLLLPVAGRAAPTAPQATENYAAPFATENGRAIWSVEGGAIADGVLRLEAGGSAVGPWVEARPGLAYEFRATGEGPLRVVFAWEDVAREPIGGQAASFGAGAARVARFAAPVGGGTTGGGAGLRLRLEAPGGPATVRAPTLRLADGVRVEPFPDGQRAALAFSFDWESAMGGLIHSRAVGGEGEGSSVGLRPDGGPSLAEAEAKGLRMREGARFLADLFAQRGIRATFYATGYNLLDGNPACQKFLGDPVYRNANAANGWGSDWWRTHPWYGDDPCTTEAQAPAWYFAAEARALAAAGQEVASHTFGHLYVRGVSPEQLRADLELWAASAAALGLPPARTFAFPWTSSNSLTPDFWAVFARVGMATLTRLYPPDLRRPYELAPVAGEPGLLVFPDFYLASRAEALDEALARIDVTLASRGYHSLWTHPNEVLEQGGQDIWQRAVGYAAAQRERGLWIAPVGEIADYGRAAGQVATTALPVAGGVRLTVENRSGRQLDGLTLGLPVGGRVWVDGREVAAAPGGVAILPPLSAGARVVVLVRR